VLSVPIVLRWLLSMVGTVGRAEDTALPDWIRSSQPYRSDLFDFEDPSKDLVSTTTMRRPWSSARVPQPLHPTTVAVVGTASCHSPPMISAART
jgi:hypothetical protein